MKSRSVLVVACSLRNKGEYLWLKVEVIRSSAGLGNRASRGCRPASGVSRHPQEPQQSCQLCPLQRCGMTPCLALPMSMPCHTCWWRAHMPFTCICQFARPCNVQSLDTLPTALPHDLARAVCRQCHADSRRWRRDDDLVSTGRKCSCAQLESDTAAAVRAHANCSTACDKQSPRLLLLLAPLPTLGSFRCALARSTVRQGITQICQWMRRGHADDVIDATWSGDGTGVVSASIENTVILWDVAKAKRKVR